MMNEESLNRELIDTFEEVKEVVRKNEGASRGGLMLGVQNLGGYPNGFVGAYYPVDSNMIVVNSSPLQRVIETNPLLLKPYIFTVLLHEYIHALGVKDESQTRIKTHELALKEFGGQHIATKLAGNMEEYLPSLVYPAFGWKPSISSNIRLVRGFDHSSAAGYIR